MKTDFKARRASVRRLCADDRRRMLQKAGGWSWSLFRGALLIGLSFVLLYPVLYMITASIRDMQDMYDVTVNWIPKHYSLETLRRVWNALDYPRSLLYTALLSLACSLLTAVSCSLAAYGLARFRFRGQKALFALMVLMIIIPPYFYNMPQYIRYRSFDFFGILSVYGLVTGTDASVNLLGSSLTMLLPALLGAGLRSGLFIYLFRQSFKGLPRELEEAAYIDGCGYLRTFIRIIVPTAMSVFVTVFLFSFVWYWNDYQVASLMIGTDQKTLSASMTVLDMLIYQQNAAVGEHLASNHLRTALDKQGACLLLVAPLLVLYLFLQRFFVESIERTGLVE